MQGHEMEGVHRCAIDIKDDLKALLACIRCGDDNNNVTRVQEAMKALMIICENMSCSKEIFRHLEGLDFILHFIRSTSNLVYIDCGLKTLACMMDQNAMNQKQLTTKEVFVLIRTTLTRMDVTPSLLKSVSLFTSTLLYKNALAQVLFTESSCISIFIAMYEKLFPPSMLGHVSVNKENDASRVLSTEIWQAVNTVMCFSMNNPVNSSNQAKAARLFPMALRILQCSSYCEVVSAVASFLSSLIIDNKDNQDLLIKHNGLTVLKNCLEVGITAMHSKTRFGSVSEQDIQATIGIIGVINVAITENEDTANLFGEMGIVTPVVMLLFSNLLGDSNKTQIVLMLSHLIESSGKSASYVLSEQGFLSFLDANCQSNDEDFLRACRYLVKLLLMQDDVKGNGTVSDKLSSSRWYLFSSHSSGPSCITKRALRDEERGVEICSTSSESTHESERIALKKIKQDRVKQYVSQVNSLRWNPRARRNRNVSERHSRRAAFPAGGLAIKSRILSTGQSPQQAYDSAKRRALSPLDDLNNSAISMPGMPDNAGSLGCPFSQGGMENVMTNDVFRSCKAKGTYTFSDEQVLHIVQKIDNGFSCQSASSVNSQGRDSVSVMKSDHSRSAGNCSCTHGKYERGTLTNNEQIYREKTIGITQTSAILQGDVNDDRTMTQGVQESSNFLKPVGVPQWRKKNISVQVPTPRVSLKNPSSGFMAQNESGRKTNASIASSATSERPDSSPRKSTSHFVANKAGRTKKVAYGSEYSFNSDACTFTDFQILRSKAMTSNRGFGGSKGNCRVRNSDSLISAFSNDSGSYSRKTIDVVKCTPNPELMSKRLSRENTRRVANETLRSHGLFGKCRRKSVNGNEILSSEDKQMDKPFFKVMVFPATKCAKHGLINSIEKVWFKPVRDCG